MKRQKIYSSEGNWGLMSVRAPIEECFKEYGRMKPTSIHSIWSSQSDNPFTSSVYYRLCDQIARNYESTMLGGRKPASVSAAIVWGVGKNLNLGIKQFWIAKYFGVTEVSLRNNLNYLYKQGLVE